MSDNLLNISQAAKKLGVAAVTLRLWERQGKIKSLRTSGNQRRYSLEMLKAFQDKSEIRNPKSETISNNQASNFQNQILKSPLLIPMQKKILGFVLAAIILAGGGAGIYKYSGDKVLGWFKNRGSFENFSLSTENLGGSVLAAESITDDYRFVVNIPALFNKDITAPNVIYGLTAGENITVSAGQNPTISSVLPDQFKNFKVGSTTITAGSKTDTLELVAGSNVTLSTSDKKITITSAVTDVTTSGITDDGTMVRLTTATDNFGLGAATGAAKLNLNVDDTRNLITASQSGSLKFRLTSAGIIDTGIWQGTAIDNAYLANSSLTITAGTALTGGGTISLGGSTTLSVTADSIGDTQLAYNTGQHLTTTSSPTFDGLTVSAGQISNTELANSAVTVSAGTGLSGGGSVSLGSAVTLSLPTVTTALGGTNITSYTTGDILYSSATNTLAKLGIGSTDQILVVSGGIPAWVSNLTAPSSGAFGYWTRTGTTLSPVNASDNLSLAGNATTSGTLTFTGTAAQVGTTNMRTLTLGTATTGNIVIDSGSGSIALSDNTTFSGNIDIAGSTTANGSFTLGDDGDTGSIDTSDWNINTTGDMTGIGAITANGTISFTGTSTLANVNVAADADIIPVTATGTNDLGSVALPWDNLYITNVFPQGTTGTIGWLQRNAGTLSPLNITDDFVLGATATASALFQIFGLTGNATSAGNLTFNTAATIATTAKQTLTIGDANTGDIAFSQAIRATQGGTAQSTYTTGDILYSSATNALSKLGIGGANQVLAVSSGIPGWVDSSSLADSTWQRLLGVVAPRNITDDLSIGGTATSSSKFQIFGLTGNATSAGNLIFNTAATISTTAMQTLTLGNATTGNIQIGSTNTLITPAFRFTTGAAVGYALTSDGSGNASWTNTAGAGSFGAWTLTGTTLYPNSTTYDVLIGSTTTTDDIGKLNVSGAKTGKALVIFNESGDQNILAASASGVTKFVLDRTGAITTGIWNGTAITNAYLAGSITAAKLVGTDIATVGTITSGTWNGTAIGAIYGGTGQTTWTTGDILYSSAANTLAKLGIGAADQVLKVTAGLPSWGSVTSSNWRIASGAISPLNDTLDVLVGNIASASAKFQISATTGTASSAGNLVFNTGASIGTTAKQTLTLGDANTGNIVIDSGSGKITLSDDITASGGLTVAGATVLNGAFTLGDNGDTGSINTSDWDITTTGDMTGIGAITLDGTITSTIGTGATAVGFTLNTASMTTQGAKLLSLQNASTEKFYVDKDGNLYVAGTILSGNGSGMLMTNKSGATVTNRSLVVLDTANNSSFTTTTTAYSKTAFGVVTGVGLGVTNDANGDGICNANDICMVAVAGEVEVLLTNASTAVKGDYIFTSATAGSGVSSSKLFDGLIGIVSNTANGASGYVKMIFKVQPQVTAAASIDKGSKHNEYWLYANKYTAVGEGADVNANLLNRGLAFDTLSDTTKIDTANTTASVTTSRAGLMGGQTLATSTTDNAGNTYLGSNTVNKTILYERTRDSSAQVQVELGIDPNWYNGVTLAVATSSASFSQNSVIASGAKQSNPNLSTTYNGSAIKVTGNYTSNAKTIYITIKSPTTFDWTDYNGQAATGVTITPGTAQTLGSTGVSAKFTDTKYNTGDVFKIASWFVEPASSTRGGTAKFPERSTIIATASSVDIIDADTQKLWMRFSTGTNFALGTATTNTPNSVHVLNGKAYVAMNGATATGLYTLDFVHDAAFRQNATDWRLSDTALSGRNATNTYNVLNTSNILVNATVNDVSAAVIPNQPTQNVTVSGWGYIQGNTGATTISETVNLPYKFNSAPNISITSVGESASAPTNLQSCTAFTGNAYAASNTVTTTSFSGNIQMRSGFFPNTNYFCYSWTATGQVSPRTYVGVATDGGVSVINETDQSTVDFQRNNDIADDVRSKQVQLLNNGDLYIGTTDLTTPAGNQFLSVYYKVPGKSSETSWAQYRNGFYQVLFGGSFSGSGPNINGTSSSDTIQSLYATQGTSTIDSKSNTLYVGTNQGVSIIQEKQSGANFGDGTDENNGSIKYYTKDYISEEMVGNVLGMWPLNNANSSSDFEDVSVNAKNLTGTNITANSDSASGVRGTATDFDGSTEYVATANDPYSNSQVASGSVSVWFKTTTTASADLFNDEGYITLVTDTSGKLVGCSDGACTNITGNKTINDNQWHFAVLTWTSNTTKIYVDGILDASGTPTGSPTPDSTASRPFTIGANFSGAVKLAAIIDDVTITGTVLSASQIKHMYQVGYRALQSHATTLGGGAADANQQLGFISTGTNTVGAVGVDYNNQFMYVGTNSTTLGAVSKIDLNSDTNIKTYNSSANVPAGGALLIDEDTTSLAVGYNLEAVGSATTGVKTMGVDNNATATSGNFIGKTVTTIESFTQAYIWAQYVLDASDASNTVTVSASNDGGSNYYQCNQTASDAAQTPTEYEYFCQFNAAGSSLKTKFAFARGSTKTNTYVTRYGIAWIGSDAVGGAPGGNGLYTNNNASVANGSFIDVAHNQNSNDVVTNGWVYNTAEAKWQQIDNSDPTNGYAFGNGADGAITVTASKNLNTDTIASGRTYADGIAYKVDMNLPISGNSLTTSDTPSGLASGDEILLINLQGASGDTGDVGKYEFLRIHGITGKQIFFNSIIQKTYTGTTASNQKVVVQRIPQYTSVTLSDSGSLTASAWDALVTTPTGAAGYLTGIVAFRATGTVSVGSGTSITVAAKGYRGIEAFCGTSGGGTGGTSGNGTNGTCGGGGGGSGGSTSGGTGSSTGGAGGGGGGATSATGGGANGGTIGGTAYGGNGGSGGYGTAGSGGLGPWPGSSGGTNTSGNGGSGTNAEGRGGGGGGTYGSTTLSSMFYGSGGAGGGGGIYANGGNGGLGSGILFIAGSTISVSGTITTNGGSGGNGSESGAGGGGAGGSIYIVGNSITLGSSLVTASGGNAGSSGWPGGAGGSGRIRVEYIGTLSGTTSPSASTATTLSSQVFPQNGPYVIKQQDTNTVRLYNYSGAAQNLRLDVITGGLGRNAGTVSLAPAAADVDAQDSVNSIWINRTGLDGSILKLQKSGTDILNLAQTGGRAALILDQRLEGDIFTASASGTTRLTLTNAGQLQLPTTGSTAGLRLGGDVDLYRSAANELTIPDAASVSGTLTLYGTPTIASTAMQTLNLGGTTTGNIQLAAGSATPAFVLTTAGNVGIGTTGPGASLDVLTQDSVGNANTNVLILRHQRSGAIGAGLATGLLFASKDDGGQTISTGGIRSIFTTVTNTATKADLAFFTHSFNEDGNTYSSQVEKMRISSTGNVGIGTTGPESKLQVTGGGLCVGSDANCNTDNNTEGTVYAATTAMTVYDVAENYPTKDATLSHGEVVELDPANGVFVRRSSPNSPYSQQLLGIVSTAPGVLLGGFNGAQFKEEHQVAVALAGRVPVKIDPDSEPIAVGDFLTSSDKPGLARKATKAGYTVGKALESWTGQEKIDAFVNIGYFMGPMTADGYFDTGMKIKVADVKIDTEEISLREQIASISAELVNLKMLSASPSANIIDSQWSYATASGKLMTAFDTQVPSLTVTGKLQVGLLTFDDLEASISSLTGVITVKGDLAVTGSLKVLGQSAGRAVIPAGSTSLTLDSQLVSTSSAIFATPEKQTVPVSTESSESGKFILRIPAALPNDLKINWWVVN